ncbi:MAG: hypothetical protein HYU80_01025 [Candidatus Blackburnbacteria bacterium]|nr:hypothetical protein [Candidatus Blackburnbacteria bacterium]
MQNLDIKTFQNVLSESKSVLVVLPEKPSLDSVAGALGLSLSFKEGGKEVTVASPSPMLVESNRLVGVNKITDNIDNRNLTITFKDYDAEGIEKVSYNIENGKFALLVTPKVGVTAPSEDQINVGYKGVSADLVIVVGASDKNSLGKFNEQGELWNGDLKVSLVNNTPPQGFSGGIELVNPQASSVSEVAFQIIESLGLPVNQDLATNLFMGLRAGTDSFQKNITAETFAVASRLLRAGARIEPVVLQSPKPANDQNQNPAVPREWMEQPRVFKGTTLP